MARLGALTAKMWQGPHVKHAARAACLKLRCSPALVPLAVSSLLAQTGAVCASSTAAAGASAGGAAGLFASVLTVAPPLAFFSLQLSGLKTVREIKRTGAVGALDPLPFVSLYTNCLVWSLYGGLLGDLTVLLPNLTGAMFGLYYTSVYRRYAERSLLPYYAGSGAIVGGVGLAALTMQPASAATVIGLTGCTLAVILMASPLATMRTVIASRNTSSMPFATSVAGFLNASSWAAYGLLVANDPMIYAPNLLGLAASSVGLGLFARYGIHTNSAGSLPTSIRSKAP